MNDGYRLTDLERRLHNLLMVGTIAAVDTQTARCRVEVGSITTTWLPWLTQRAGPDRTWWAPEPGEQVLMLSPSGDTAQAIVLPALYRAAHPAPGERVTHHVTEYADGTRIDYDREAGHLTVDCVGDVTIRGGRTLHIDFGGSITLDASDVTINAPVQVNASVTASGDMVADGVSQVDHIHDGDSGGKTSPPKR
ncbi:phage baseplate assembly protein V [Kushneria sinocarnis]|uniref:Phage baseplate assembly protein V n=1 Tax=Kushneria sinocarnis TaxID=595502 RepID=A0A420WVL0_9GAMM|nr:phage baseplate assembly protein V [Kushneria sinocarnis]RKR02593.1 phage baseplate assembly protein V [Kushneria sinocarnis]